MRGKAHRVFNFSAGPAVLPEPVLEQAQAEMLDWKGSGMSVMEVSHRGSDFIELAESIPPADIVTLDRVINVYPDWERLVQLSAARARRLYGLVYPRDTLPVGMVVALMNLVLARGPVRAAVCPHEAVQKLVGDAGLLPCSSATAGPWQVALYRRRGTACA